MILLVPPSPHCMFRSRKTQPKLLAHLLPARSRCSPTLRYWWPSLVHNAEEYPAIVDYANRHGWRVDKTQMFTAIVLATILSIPVAAAAARSPKGSRRLALVLTLQGALAVNALGHLGQTFWYRDYSPGTLTGLGVNVPFAAYIYRRAVREGYLCRTYADRESATLRS